MTPRAVLKVDCPTHGRVDVPAPVIVLTWTAAGDPSGCWVARMDCPGGGHRIGASGLTTRVVRGLVAAGARHVEPPVPFEPLAPPTATPRQYRPVDVRDALTIEDVVRIVAELHDAVDLAGHAASEQKVLDAQRRRTGGAA